MNELMDARKQYLKALARHHQITTPDKLLGLPDVAVEDIDHVMGYSEFREACTEIMTESKASLVSQDTYDKVTSDGEEG